MASVEERLFKMASESFDLGSDPDWDMKLSDSDISSVDAVAFMKRVNSDFGVDIQPEELAEIDSLRQLAETVASRSG